MLRIRRVELETLNRAKKRNSALWHDSLDPGVLVGDGAVLVLSPERNADTTMWSCENADAI